MKKAQWDSGVPEASPGPAAFAKKRGGGRESGSENFVFCFLNHFIEVRLPGGEKLCIFNMCTSMSSEISGPRETIATAYAWTRPSLQAPPLHPPPFV